MAMLSSIEIIYLLLLSILFVVLYLRHSESERGNNESDRNGIREAKTSINFIPNPKPLFTVTPESLSEYHGERDHIYVNKVLRHPYHQTMAHQPMQVDDWIEIDSCFRDDLRRKADLIKVQGKVVLDIVDDAAVALGCQELMQHVCDWITLRYPNLFKWQDSEKRVVHNLAMNDAVSLYDEQGLKRGIDALLVVSRLVQDDFLITSPMKDGHWLCAGGLVCFPGFYLLSEKINTTLFQTHSPVPQFNEKLLNSVERSLTRLEPHKPFERTSWEIIDSEEDQFWVPMAGPLPTGSGAKATSLHHQRGRSEDACKHEDPSQLLLRLDHQTFVKMPKSGIVFFGVHPFRRKLSRLRDAPMLPRLLLDIHREGPADLMKYKAAPMYEASVIPYLESLDDWQKHYGLMKKGEKSADFRLFKSRSIIRGC